MKVTLINFDNEERAKVRVVRTMYQYYLQNRDASWQKLRDNAGRFKKEPEVMKLISISKEQDQQ